MKRRKKNASDERARDREKEWENIEFVYTVSANAPHTCFSVSQNV